MSKELDAWKAFYEERNLEKQEAAQLDIALFEAIEKRLDALEQIDIGPRLMCKDTEVKVLLHRADWYESEWLRLCKRVRALEQSTGEWDGDDVTLADEVMGLNEEMEGKDENNHER